MATEVGLISALIGTATATATDGTVRTLQVGDKVYPNEIITTGLAGAVEVEFLDGSLMDLGRNSQAVLDNETFDFDNATPPAATADSDDSDVFDDIEAIQQALLEGADPTAIADPTAAGPGAQPSSEGGSDAVVVDYLAPRVTPQAGFDTTGPGVSFPDPPPFQFLVDGSDDPLLPPGEIPPGSETPIPPGEQPPGEPSLNTPPVADPVLTSYSFSKGAGEDLPADSYIFQKFTVGGGVDESEFGLKSPTIFEAEPSLGGDDGPDGTPESSLIFTLTTDPAFGTLYKKVGNDWGELKAGEEGKDTFNAGDSIFWSATQEEFNAHIVITPAVTYGGAMGKPAWEGIELSATGLNDVEANLVFHSHGVGVAGGTIVPGQLEYRDGQSEEIRMKFANPSTDAEITVSRLIAKEKEVGQVEAFLNGESMGIWTFTTANGIPFLDGEKIDFSLANGNLNSGPTGMDNAATFKLEGVIFDELVFRATEYVDGASPQPHGGDSSDYYIQSVSVKEIATTLPEVSFEYIVTDEAGNSSTPVEVVISAGNDAILGNEQGDVLSGGPGNDILTGGAGEDIFVWNAGDEGTAVAPAHDIVTDFTEGDVLDFSDILVGEESGDLTDFIYIAEDGADIVIKLSPDLDANDVTQIVTLQGKSLADLGVGGYDVASQQADIIKQLVEDGHINVDS